MFIPYAISLYVYILNKILTQEEIKGPIKRCICLILSHDLPYLPCHVLNLWTVGILHVLQALPWCSSSGSVGVHLPLKSARGVGGIRLQLCSHPICCHSWNLLGGNSLLCTELKPLCGSSLLAVLEQWKILVQLQRALGQTEQGVCGVPQQPPAAPAPTSSFEMAKTRGRHPTTI